MRSVIKSFDELTNEELYEILKLRQIVFVVEQDCPYLDADDKDQESKHVLLYEDDELIGYARLLPEGLSYEGFSAIGRVVVHPERRRKGLGSTIMKLSIAGCREMSSLPIKLSAQVYALDLYANLGFVPVGKTYLEDGIPHQAMVLEKE